MRKLATSPIVHGLVAFRALRCQSSRPLASTKRSHIQNTPGLPLNIRDDIVTMVTNATPRTNHQEKQTDNQLSRSMLVKKKLAHGVVRGSGPQRETRRAILLLWRATGGLSPCPEIAAPRRDASASEPAR